MKSSCIGAGVMAGKLVNCSLSIFEGLSANPVVMYGSMLCLTIIGVCVAAVVREFACHEGAMPADQAELALEQVS